MSAKTLVVFFLCLFFSNCSCTEQNLKAEPYWKNYDSRDKLIGIGSNFRSTCPTLICQESNGSTVKHVMNLALEIPDANVFNYRKDGKRVCFKKCDGGLNLRTASDVANTKEEGNDQWDIYYDENNINILPFQPRNLKEVPSGKQRNFIDCFHVGRCMKSNIKDFHMVYRMPTPQHCLSIAIENNYDFDAFNMVIEDEQTFACCFKKCTKTKHSEGYLRFSNEEEPWSMYYDSSKLSYT